MANFSGFPVIPVEPIGSFSKRNGQTRGTASRNDGDSNPIENEILLALPRAEFDAVSSNLEFVRLRPLQVLHETGETLRSAYFCNSGMFSVLNIMPDGKRVEVGLIGKEGFSGNPLVAGFRTSHTRTVAQAEAKAFRIDADAFRSLLPRCPKLERQINRFVQLMGLQVTQLAACNRLHEVKERLARSLLMTQDRIGSESIPLTQEFLSQMLGTGRSSVTVAAGELRTTGLISYTRKNVAIFDRPKLEEAACECYAMLRKRVQQWQKQDL